jgi:hypothetical protein
MMKITVNIDPLPMYVLADSIQHLSLYNLAKLYMLSENKAQLKLLKRAYRINGIKWDELFEMIEQIKQEK